MIAKDLLNPAPPVAPAFNNWLAKNGKQATRRKGREFLAKYPQFRSAPGMVEIDAEKAMKAAAKREKQAA
jgi:hypothetical protein